MEIPAPERMSAPANFSAGGWTKTIRASQPTPNNWMRKGVIETTTPRMDDKDRLASQRNRTASRRNGRRNGVTFKAAATGRPNARTNPSTTSFGVENVLARPGAKVRGRRRETNRRKRINHRWDRLSKFMVAD